MRKNHMTILAFAMLVGLAAGQASSMCRMPNEACPQSCDGQGDFSVSVRTEEACPTPSPTKSPTPIPTKKPTNLPTVRPTKFPTRSPTPEPSKLIDIPCGCPNRQCCTPGSMASWLRGVNNEHERNRFLQAVYEGKSSHATEERSLQGNGFKVTCCVPWCLQSPCGHGTVADGQCVSFNANSEHRCICKALPAGMSWVDDFKTLNGDLRTRCQVVKFESGDTHNCAVEGCNPAGTEAGSCGKLGYCKCLPGFGGPDCSIPAEDFETVCGPYSLPRTPLEGGPCRCLDGVVGDRCDRFAFHGAKTDLWTFSNVDVMDFGSRFVAQTASSAKAITKYRVESISAMLTSSSFDTRLCATLDVNDSDLCNDGTRVQVGNDQVYVSCPGERNELFHVQSNQAIEMRTRQLHKLHVGLSGRNQSMLVSEIQAVHVDGVMVKLLKPQSSSADEAGAAIDGKKSTAVHLEGDSPWWSAEFDLPDLTQLSAVQVFRHPLDSFMTPELDAILTVRINNEILHTVKRDGLLQVYPLNSGTPVDQGGEEESETNGHAPIPLHQVRVDLPGSHSDNVLSMREVKLLDSEGQALVLFNARQSSVSDGNYASNVIDGSLDTFSQTGGTPLDQHAPWWTANFQVGDISRLASIKIYNRNDDTQDRLIGAVVSVNGVQVGKIADSQAEYTFNTLPDLTKRHNLRIEIPRVENLHLREVELLGSNGQLIPLVNARQSSVSRDRGGFLATDGDLTNYMHTYYGNEGVKGEPWWSADFDTAKLDDVVAVKLFNREGKYNKRLVGARVTIDGKRIATISSGMDEYLLPCDDRFIPINEIRFELPGVGATLSIREVKLVDSEGQALVLFNARQSSVSDGNYASNVIDGSLDTFSQTGGTPLDQHAPWWAADFRIGDISRLASIKIYNRNDDTQDRLIGAVVSVNGVQVGKVTNSQAEYTFSTLPDLTKRHNLRIEIPRVENLHLREVEVLGSSGELIPLLNARQSSVSQGRGAFMATDGDLGPHMHTFYNENGAVGEPWWSADFDIADLQDVVAVRILNRQTWLRKRLVGAQVTIDGKQIAVIEEGKDEYEIASASHVLRIDLPGRDKTNVLHMREVKLLKENLEEVILFHARQSTTEMYFHASNAIDGDDSTISHTGTNHPVETHAPWWAASFRIRDISQLTVEIHNWDDDATTQERLLGAVISVDGVQIGKVDEPQAVYKFEVPDLSLYHNLRIEIPRIEHLHIREVELLSRDGQTIPLMNPRQSTRGFEFYASNAIDGDESTFSHTWYGNIGAAGQPWWTADFKGHLHEVAAVRIVNRNETERRRIRLVGAIISIDGEHVATISEPKAEYSFVTPWTAGGTTLSRASLPLGESTTVAVSLGGQEVTTCVLSDAVEDVYAAVFLDDSASLSGVDVQLANGPTPLDQARAKETCKARLRAETAEEEPCPCGQQRDQSGACIEPAAVRDADWGCDYGVLHGTTCFVWGNTSFPQVRSVAREVCSVAFGQLLFSLHNESDVTFVLEQFKDDVVGPRKVWLGLSWDRLLQDNSNVEDWILRPDAAWDDGTPFDYDHFGPDKSQLKRYLSDDQETCFFMDLDTGKWDAGDCSDEMLLGCGLQAMPTKCDDGFVFDWTKFKCVQGDEKPAVCDTNAGYELLAESTCFKVEANTRVNLEDARATCMREGGHLASFLTVEEHRIVSERIASEAYSHFWVGLKVTDNEPKIWDDGVDVNSTVWATLKGDSDKAQDPACVFMSRSEPNNLDFAPSCDERHGFVCMRFARGCPQEYAFQDGRCVRTKATALQSFTEDAVCADLLLSDSKTSPELRSKAVASLERTATCLATRSDVVSDWTPKLRRVAGLAANALRNHVFEGSSEEISNAALTWFQLGALAAHGPARALRFAEVRPAFPADLKPFMQVHSNSDNDPLKFCRKGPCPCGMWRGSEDQSECTELPSEDPATQLERSVAYARCAMLDEYQLAELSLVPAHVYLSRAVTCAAKVPINDDNMRATFRSALDQIQQVLDAQVRRTFVGTPRLTNIRKMLDIIRQRMDMPPISKTTTVPAYAVTLINEKMKDFADKLRVKAQGQLQRELNSKLQKAIEAKLNIVHKEISERIADLSGDISELRQGLADVVGYMQEGAWKSAKESIRTDFEEINMLGAEINTIRDAMKLKSDQLTHAIRQLVASNDQMSTALSNFNGPLEETMFAAEVYFNASTDYKNAEESYRDAQKALQKIQQRTQVGLMAAGMIAGGALTMAGAPIGGMMAMMVPSMIPMGAAGGGFARGGAQRRQLQQGTKFPSPSPTLYPTMQPTPPTKSPTPAPTVMSTYQAIALAFGSFSFIPSALAYWRGLPYLNALYGLWNGENRHEHFYTRATANVRFVSDQEWVGTDGEGVERKRLLLEDRVKDAFADVHVGKAKPNIEVKHSMDGQASSYKVKVTIWGKVFESGTIADPAKIKKEIEELQTKFNGEFDKRWNKFKWYRWFTSVDKARELAVLPNFDWDAECSRRRLQQLETEDQKTTFLNNLAADMAIANAELQAGAGLATFSNVAQMAATAIDTILGRNETYFSHLCFGGEVVQLHCGDGLYVSCCANERNSCDFGVDADSGEPLCERLSFEDVISSMLPFDLPDSTHWIADCMDEALNAVPLMYPAGDGLVLSCCVDKSMPEADRVSACNLTTWETSLVDAQVQQSSQRALMRTEHVVNPRHHQRELRSGRACTEAQQKAQKLDKWQKLGGKAGAAGVLVTIALATASAVLAFSSRPPELPNRNFHDIFNPNSKQVKEGMTKLEEGIQQIGLSIFSLLQRTTLVLLGVDFNKIPDVTGIPGFQDESSAMPEVWDGMFEKLANVLEYDFELCPKDRIEGVRDENTNEMCDDQGEVEGCENKNRLRLLQERASPRDMPVMQGARRLLDGKEHFKTKMKTAACAAENANRDMCQAHADFKTAQAKLRDECRDFREGLRLVTVWGKAIHQIMYEFVDGFRQIKLLQDKQRIQLDGVQDTVDDMLDLDARGDLLAMKIVQRKPLRALPDYSREEAFAELAAVVEETKVEEDMFFVHNSASELIRDYCGAILYAKPSLKSQLDQLCNIAFGQVDGDADSLHFLADRLDAVRVELDEELNAAYFNKLGNDKEWSVLDVTRAVDMQAFAESNYTYVEFALGGPPLSNPVNTSSFQSHYDPHFCVGLGNVEMREFGLVFYDTDSELIGPVADPRGQKDLDMVISLEGPFVKAGTSSEMDFATGNVVVTKVWEESFSIQKRQGKIGSSEYKAYTEFYEYHTFGPNGKCRAGEETEPCPGLFKTDPNGDRRKFMPLASPYARYSVALLPDSAKMLRDRGVARIELRAKLYGDLDIGMEAICKGQAVFQLSPPAQDEENTKDDGGFPVAAAVASGAAGVLVLFVLAVLLHRRREQRRQELHKGVVVVSEVPERSSTVMPATYSDEH